MNYSRIYKFTSLGSGGRVVLDSALPDSNNDEVHENLFDSLRAVFHTHPRRQFGLFDAALPDADPTLTGLASSINDYHNKKIDAEAFGLRLANQLLSGIHSSDNISAWYFWFISEEGGDGEIIYLFLLKPDEVHHISAQHTVTTGSTIQPSRLQYAAKLNLTEWQSADSKTYLGYLAPKNQDPITSAWKALVGFSEGTDRSAQTRELLAVVNRYAEELPAEKEQEYRSRVVNYCLDRDRAGEPVEIKALSRHVDEAAPEALITFYSEQVEAPTTELHADRKQLKRYTRFYGRDNDLSIGFSTLMLGRDVIYDEASGTLTIRVIPKSLKSQLARHGKKPE